MKTSFHKSELTYPSWVEEAAERALRVKAIHIGGILAREASTSGVLTHKGRVVPFHTDKAFPSFPGTSFLLTTEGKQIQDWLAVHKPVSLTSMKRKGREGATSHAFPILSPVAKPTQEHEGAEGRQAAYEGRLQGAHGAPGGPRRTWLDKLVN